MKPLLLKPYLFKKWCPVFSARVTCFHILQYFTLLTSTKYLPKLKRLLPSETCLALKDHTYTFLLQLYQLYSGVIFQIFTLLTIGYKMIPECFWVIACTEDKTAAFFFEITIFSNGVVSQTNWNGCILKYSALKIGL